MSPVLSRLAISAIQCHWKTSRAVHSRVAFSSPLSKLPAGRTHELIPKNGSWRGIRGQNNSHSQEKFVLNPKNIVPGEPAHFKMLTKPFLFTVLFSGFSFAGATIWQYENIRKHAKSLIRPQLNWKQSFAYKHGNFRREINRWWAGQTEGQKVAWGIIGLNALVFVLWKVPSLQPVMLRYFCSNPASKTQCLPMLLSTFSHYSFIHCAANMYVLYTFSTTAVSLLGKEQFVAFYLSAGVWSSFISYLHKIATAQVAMSLGASGALMAVLGAVCLQYPDTKLAFIFLPMLTFSAGTALKTIMALDTAGLVLKWRFFDHAAHLGGVLFGISYLVFGRDHIWGNRGPLMEWWHNLREDAEK